MTCQMRILKTIPVTPEMLHDSSIAETDCPQWVEATEYGVGPTVRVIDEHVIYESVRDVNTGNKPKLSPTWWGVVGPTNRWAPFDNKASTKLELAAGSHWYEIKPGRVITDLAVIAASGVNSVRARMIGTTGTVFDSTLVMRSQPATPRSMWSFYFERRVRQNRGVISGLTPDRHGTLRIDIEAATIGARIGAIALARRHAFGVGVSTDAKLDLIDFSVLRENQLTGEVDLKPKPPVNRMTLTIVLRRSEFDSTWEFINSLVGTSCLFQASSEFKSMTIWGYIEAASQGPRYYNHPELNITVRSFV